MEQIVKVIAEFGFPVAMALGMGYFIYYVWKYVTEKLEPIIDDQHMTLIKLIDQVRMLDQDQIRLKQKLETALEFKERENREEDNS